MKYGWYSDSELPEGNYRCPSWDPMPDGKKNVVVLGCSHTYGVGHEDAGAARATGAAVARRHADRSDAGGGGDL